MKFTYLLLLENDKYYLGTSDNFREIIQMKVSSVWTKIYKPIKIIEIFEGNTDFSRYRNIYGNENILTESSDNYVEQMQTLVDYLKKLK